MEDNAPTISIYRFKFGPDFIKELSRFAKLHQYDDRHAFREAWDIWVEENNDIIMTETRTLENNGYEGDVLDKMYKSARYYFRKKTDKKVNPKKRKVYISMDRDMLDLMDEHIMDSMKLNDYCPANGFNEFCKSNEECIGREVNRFVNDGISGDEINIKFKKTYKNRYFQISQNIVK